LDILLDLSTVHIIAVVVGHFVVGRKVTHANLSFVLLSDPSVSDDSSVFALNRAVSRECGPLWRSVEAFVRPKSFFFFVATHILLNHWKVHVSLGPVRQVLQTTRLWSIVGIRAASVRDSGFRWGFLDLGSQESGACGGKAVRALDYSVSVVLRCR